MASTLHEEIASQLLAGGTISLAKATYDLAEALVLDVAALKRPLVIQGGFARLRPLGTVAGALVRVTGASRDYPVTVENLIIDCGSAADVGLRVESCAGARTRFRGVRVANPRSCGFELASTGNIDFEDCMSIQELPSKATAMGWRLTRSLGTRLLRCDAIGFDGSGIHIDATEGIARCAIVDARVTDNGGAGVWLTSDSTTPSAMAEFTVRGGYFARNGNGAIRIEPTVLGAQITEARFVNGTSYPGSAVTAPAGSALTAGNCVLVVEEAPDGWADYTFASPSWFRPDLVIAP